MSPSVPPFCQCLWVASQDLVQRPWDCTHSLQDESSFQRQIFKLLGVGSRSVTEQKRKLNFTCWVCHNSFHNSTRSYDWSHCVHRHWEAGPKAFNWRSSATASRTLCNTRPLLALSSALLQLFTAVSQAKASLTYHTYDFLVFPARFHFPYS